MEEGSSGYGRTCAFNPGTNRNDSAIRAYKKRSASLAEKRTLVIIAKGSGVEKLFFHVNILHHIYIQQFAEFKSYFFHHSYMLVAQLFMDVNTACIAFCYS